MTYTTNGVSFTHEVKTPKQEQTETVQVEFKTKQLERCYRNSKEAQRQWGAVVARKYIQRIKLISAANGIEDLRKLPALRYHALKGDHAGEHAIDLTGFWRLIVTELPGGLRIEEVSKHCGD